MAGLRHIFWFNRSESEMEILRTDSTSTNRMSRLTSYVQSPFTGYGFLKKKKYKNFCTQYTIRRNW